ncbi:type II toxin-antitoxin system Phd/YefM family antitoxin [Desulfonatronum parangueonense]
METMSYTKLRNNLAKVMDRVVEDHDTVIVTRNNEPGVVILSLEDYEALLETAYLMKSPANARRMIEAVEQIQQGKTSSHSLADIAELADDH